MNVEWLGFAGIGLSVIAYLPQIIHLIKEHCSAGLSTGAYSIWVVSTLLLLTYAIANNDLIFMSLQSYQLTATAMVLYYSLKYRGRRCEGKTFRAEADDYPSIDLSEISPCQN